MLDNEKLKKAKEFLDKQILLKHQKKEQQAILDSLLNDKQFKLSLKGEQGQKGDKGEPGKDGVDGKDGLNGMPGRDGRNGRDGSPGLNGRDGADGLPGKDGRLGKDGLPGKDGRDGKDGRNGIDGSPDSPEDIVNKINSLVLKPEFMIDAAHIKNLPKSSVGFGSVGRVLSLSVSGQALLVGDITFQAGSNITLTQVGQNITVASAGGGGLSSVVNDTNVTGVLSVGGTILTLGWTGTLAVGRGGTGTATAFTPGSVIFAGAGGTYSQNNANFFWDNTNFRLGIGINLPLYTLDVNGNIANSSGALGFYAGGVNQNINFTPSGTGINNFVSNTGANGVAGTQFVNNWVPPALNYIVPMAMYGPNAIANSNVQMILGVAQSLNNDVGQTFHYDGAGSTSNTLSWNFYGGSPILTLFASGLVTQASNPGVNGLAGFQIYNNFAAPNTNYANVLDLISPNLANGANTQMTFGVAASNNNRAGFKFHYAGFGSTSNYLTLGFYGNDNVLVAQANNSVNVGGNTSPTGLFSVGSSSQLQINSSGVINQYNNVATVGWGVPAIYGSGRSTAQTGAVASVATYTVGAADGSFIVSGNVNVTISTTHNFNLQCTYTDETNTVNTITMSVQQLGGTIITAITNVTGIGAYEGVPLHIRAKASTSITIKTTGTFTSVTYNVEGLIVQYA